MTELEILKAARTKLDDDDYWNKNSSDLAEYIGCGDLAGTPEAKGEFARNLFRKKLDDGIAAEEMLRQKLAIAPMIVGAA